MLGGVRVFGKAAAHIGDKWLGKDLRDRALAPRGILR
jgi:hypothetical protein